MALKLTDNDFEAEVLKAKEPVLVDFWAPWCGPCKLAGPAVDELAKDYQGKVKVGKLNVDDYPKIAEKYGVMSVPTIVIFKNGQEVERLTGFPGKQGYEDLIKKVL
ncbi:MAG TPA: thioredoxin [Candidatus Bathyarchaeia archaeon]|nr:thioredoxin [Candidatus Bathyarchaeia archaeon]